MKLETIQRPPGSFQQPVDDAALSQQLAGALPEETLQAVTELDSGWFNNSYRVVTNRSRYLLKVAPAADADVFYNERYLMQRERALSSTLQPLNSLIPEYLCFFQIDGRDAFLQPFIEGRLWHAEFETLTQAENDRLWFQLGAFSKSLEQQQGSVFGYPGPGPSFDRWSDFIFDYIRGLAADCTRLGLDCPEVTRFCELVPSYRSTLDEVRTAKLLHGDLWPRNVLIEGHGEDIRIRAVFDAERAYFGDPVSDWVSLLYGVPDAFWQGFGENLHGPENTTRMRLYKGMYFLLNLVETTRLKNDTEPPRQWLDVIVRELESPPSSGSILE